MIIIATIIRIIVITLFIIKTIQSETKHELPPLVTVISRHHRGGRQWLYIAYTAYTAYTALHSNYKEKREEEGKKENGREKGGLARQQVMLSLRWMGRKTSAVHTQRMGPA